MVHTMGRNKEDEDKLKQQSLIQTRQGKTRQADTDTNTRSNE